MSRVFAVRRETFPIRGSFRISRGAKTEAHVVVAEIRDGDAVGRGECVPYARYGETVEDVAALMESAAKPIADGLDRAGLLELMPAGAARNALDCALWDLEAKQTGRPAWQLAGLAEPPRPVSTLFTLGLDTPEAMAEAARAASNRPLLKLKLGGDGIVERVRAVREAAPGARLLIDFNEGADFDELRGAGAALQALGVEMIEQPLPAGQDAKLVGLGYPIPFGADESVHGEADLDGLAAAYRFVNIKLDKTGGLTAALAVKARAKRQGFGVMIGCMVATSLAMAPAMLLAQGAAYVDLDGPLLLARDREPGLAYRGAAIDPPRPALWG